MPQEAIDRMYDQFAPAERLTLLLEAMARRDETEVQRLRLTCPRKEYTQPDAAFDDRLRMALDVAMVSCLDLQALCGKLELLRWAMDVVREDAATQIITSALAFVDGERWARGLGQTDFFRSTPAPDDPAPADDGKDEDQAPQTAERGMRLAAVTARADQTTALTLATLAGAVEDIAGELVSGWSAFGRFCQSRIGVKAEVMLQSWEMPVVKEIQQMLSHYQHLQPNQARVTEMLGLICRAWDSHFGEGSGDGG